MVKLIEDCQREIRSLGGNKNDRIVKIQCSCGKDGLVRRNYPLQKDDENYYHHRRETIAWQFRGAALSRSYLKVFKISFWSDGDNGLLGKMHVNKILCHLIIDTIANFTIFRKYLAHKLVEKFFWTAL